MRSVASCTATGRNLLEKGQARPDQVAVRPGLVWSGHAKGP